MNVQAFQLSPDSFIPSLAIGEYLEGKDQVLIIGDAGGRDYLYLTGLGKKVFVVDIAPQTSIPNLIQQSITERTPFPDAYFDGVVMAEVLEHLFEDCAALTEVRRVLKEDGILVLTVPYFSNTQDEPEFHVRIHTRRTIERLLAYCGFQIEDHFFRGLVSRFPQHRITWRISVLIARCTKRLFGSRGVAVYQRVFYRLERWLGSGRYVARLQRRCTSFGGIMKVRKGRHVDFAQIQIAEFSNK